ncbi:type I restriction enzyme HsdR N-terminal domain-containing protein [Haladaptatus sp. DYSN1]|uniref:type I restriction enzyme HsdR N-terminal domain-containing protein n=1 Tax=unclassified Haladaptatus TaxID=2622732 RepID=UPI002404E5F2|nr:type I restriction enzyme HsdR N-terminal domain-containing protein [Haladaptatus sp. DYSN1]
MDEQNTKRKIIEPLLELLGWDMLSADVELEYSVQMGTGTKKVDYALKLEGTPVVFVEAKGCDTPIDGHEGQLSSYMRQVGVDWGLLTNGRRFRLYRRDHASNRPSEIQLVDFTVDEVTANEHPLRAISYGSIESGESQRIAETIEAVQRAVDSLRDNKESLAEEVTVVVTDVVGESVSQTVENEAKGFIDDLVATLEEQAHRTPPADESRSRTHEDSVDGGKYTIKLLKDGSEVHRVVADNQVGAMVALVEYLIETEELLNAVSLPYVPGTGRGSRALLNAKPTHTNGREMRQYEQVAGEYYLFTSLSAKDKKRYLRELPDKVGLQCEFGEKW